MIASSTAPAFISWNIRAVVYFSFSMQGRFSFRLFPLFLATLLGAQESVRDNYVEASLLARETHLTPGGSLLVGLRLEHDEGWHTYWKSTATGYATSIEWDLPEGLKAGDIQWAAPTVYEFSGYVEYVYENSVLLPIEITADESLRPGQTLTLTAKVDWLMCEKTCIPGEVTLELTLPVKESPASIRPESKAAFEAALQRQPVPPEVEIQAWQANKQVFLDIGRDDLESPYFFDAQALITPTLSQKVVTSNGKTRLTFNLDPAGMGSAENLVGVINHAGRPIAVDVPLQKTAPPTLAGTSGPAGNQAQGLPLILGLALLGGLILNLMPCVFPVLGIKVMGFVNQAGEERGKVVAHGLIFTLGVLVSFWILAIVLILLRSSGEQLGWGFQLQEPVFVYLLMLFLLAFGLNMSGVFEIGQSAVSVGSDLTGKSGFTGTFFSGVLATVVATPCAAPFLAPALGAALALPPAASLLTFTFIGLGLSLPYLTFSAFPRLVEYLPRPGAWMESFKQAMSFLLYATVGFLLWVLVGQVTESAGFSAFDLLYILFSMVLLSTGLWIYGRWGTFSRPKGPRRTAYAIAGICVAGAIALGYPAGQEPLNWEKWEPGKAEELASEGQVVYVDFTARWCVTCQTNKATVFSSGRVRDWLEANGVVLLKADWTNRDDRITEALARFDRSAVPFNLVYGPGATDPIELPEILTPGTVLKAMKAAEE